MKKSKKLISCLLAAALCGSVFTACAKGKDTAQSSGDGKKGNPDEIIYSYADFNKIPDDMTPIENAVNAITVPKINVKVKLKPISIANYSQQVNLAIQSGEKLDIFETLGDLNQYVSKNELAPIDDLIDKYGKETKQIVGSDFLKTAQVNGKTYGIPTYKGLATAPNIVFRSDIMKELGVSPDSIKSVSDLDALYAKVKAKYPNMIPFAPTGTGSSGLLMTDSNIDYLTDSYVTPTAVLIGDSTKVVDYYETDLFKEKINIARDWFNKGYIQKDAATSTTVALDLMKADRCFSSIASYAGKESAAAISAQSGKPIGMVRLGQTYLSTSSVNALTWGINVNCDKKEAAMKFLNMTFSDKAVINLLIYGIEGQGYVKVDADHVKYPDGKDPSSVPYTAAFCTGTLGNEFLMYQMAGQSTDDLKLMESENKNSAKSKAFGFTFDNSNVKTEYSSITNVINQYLPGLSCGSLDPNKELPNFIKALKDAGMDKIVTEKQKQLDAWLAQNK